MTIKQFLFYLGVLMATITIMSIIYYPTFKKNEETIRESEKIIEESKKDIEESKEIIEIMQNQQAGYAEFKEKWINN